MFCHRTESNLFLFLLIFRLISVPHSSAIPIQMNSIMTFIQTNIHRDRVWRWYIWCQVNFDTMENPSYCKTKWRCSFEHLQLRILQYRQLYNENKSLELDVNAATFLGFYIGEERSSQKNAKQSLILWHQWYSSLLRAHQGQVRLGYCITPYQRLRLYNGAPFSRLLRHAGDTEDVFST